MLDPGRISAAKNDRHHVQFNLSNQTGRRSSDFSYYDVMDYGNRVKQTAETYAKFRSSSGPLTAETDSLQDHDDDDDDSGYCSPPLWRTSPSASPQHRRNHYRNLSPASKAQAIARGQRELMEMVSKMPESCYELSLKDLVEQQQQPAIEVKQQDGFKEEKYGKSQELYKRERRMRNKINDKRMEIAKRNGNMSNNNKEGFLLKMVLPVGFGSKHKKKNDLASRNSFNKIIPRSPTPDGSEKGVDKEWWKKRYSVESESESFGSSRNNGSVKSSSVSSSNSSSSRRSITRPENPGCWSFIIRAKNRKNVE